MLRKAIGFSAFHDAGNQERAERVQMPMAVMAFTGFRSFG